MYDVQYNASKWSFVMEEQQLDNLYHITHWDYHVDYLHSTDGRFGELIWIEVE